jgi:NADH-quinone oxidoreductase subunit N
LNSAVAAYYYLRILVVMYMREPAKSASGESVELLAPAGAALQFAVYASAVGTLLLGIFPGWVLDVANRAALK